MSRRDQFERELSWRDDGHASDLVVSALADGQNELVREEVAEHVDECELCTDRLLQMATLSLSFDAGLREAFPERAAVLERTGAPAIARPQTGAAFPKHFFLLALALAALGVVPALRSLPAFWQKGDVVGLALGAGHELLALARGVRVVWPVVVGQSSGILIASSLFTTALCVTGGWLLARSAPAGAFERQVG